MSDDDSKYVVEDDDTNDDTKYVVEGEESEPDRTDGTTDYNPTERGKWISALIALLGLWMVVEALAFDLVAAQVWNDIVVGALLLAVGGYNYSRRSDERVGSMAAAVLAALLGLWLIASPFMFGADAGATEAVNDAGFWNDVVVGLLALVLGAYSAYEIRDQRTRTRAAAT